MKTTFTIRDLATDQLITDALDNLVDFVNNHEDARANDFEIINGSHINSVNPNPTFKLWLSHRGYTFNRFGKAVKEVA